ncbi:DNA polymerase III subunit delta [Candidatus Neomarinimicrobiota bacterium]
MSNYSDIIREIQGGKIRPVYVLAGGDPFLEDYLIRECVKKFLPQGEKKLVFSLDDDKADKLLAELVSIGMFQQRSAIVVRQVGRAAGKAREELLAYALKPNADKCLILILADWQPAKGVHKKLSKSVPVIDTRPPFPDKIKAWARYFAKTEGYVLEADALEYLLEICGDTVGHVVSELGKIFSQYDEGSTIDLPKILDQTGGGRTYQLWQFQAAIAERNNQLGLRILVSLLEHGTTGVQIVSSLANLFCQLLYLQSRTTARGVYTGLNKLVSSKLGQMTGRYSPRETKLILRQLLEADTTIKSTNVEVGTLLVPLLVGICKGSK